MHSHFDQLESRTLMSVTPVIDLNHAYVGDLNGDHKADIATLRNGQLHLLDGANGGVWREWATFPTDARLSRVSAGDFNGDGAIDLVATGIVSAADGTSNTIMVSEFLPRGEGAWDDTDIAHFSASVRPGPYDTLSGDFNGDGRDDIALAGRTNGIIAILIGLFRDHQTFGQPQTIPSPFSSSVRVATGDVNGDGDADLVSLDANGHTGVAMGAAGTGIFDDPFFFDVNAVGTAPTQRQLIADVDGDGNDDIVGFSNGTARVARLMEEEGIFYFTGTNANGLPADVVSNSAVADLDGNGTGDLLAFRTTGASFTAYTNEHGIFTPSGPDRLMALLIP